VVTIEESVFLADVKGPRRSLQIVIHGSMGGANEISVSWSLERVALAASRESGQEEEREETSELPLED
jgi:hypothetical protein